MRPVFFMLFLVLISGCSYSDKDWKRDFAEMYKGYESENPTNAEAALLKMKWIIISRPDFQKIQNTNAALGFIEARLLKLYSFLGATNKAQTAYSNSVFYLSKMAVNDGNTNYNIPTHSELLESIDKFDQKLQVRWMTNLTKISD